MHRCRRTYVHTYVCRCRHTCRHVRDVHVHVLLPTMSSLSLVSLMVVTLSVDHWIHTSESGMLTQDSVFTHYQVRTYVVAVLYACTVYALYVRTHVCMYIYQTYVRMYVAEQFGLCLCMLWPTGDAGSGTVETLPALPSPSKLEVFSSSVYHMYFLYMCMVPTDPGTL